MPEALNQTNKQLQVGHIGPKGILRGIGQLSNPPGRMKRCWRDREDREGEMLFVLFCF